MTQLEFTAAPGVPQTIIVRSFAAPRELVFRAHVEPQLVERWLGPRTVITSVDLLEARDGGRWRITHRDAQGATYAFHGWYHGNPSPDRIVRTYEFANAPGPVFLDTITLTDVAGATLLRQNTVFQTVEDRDHYLQGGAEMGVRESFARLDTLLAEMGRRP